MLIEKYAADSGRVCRIPGICVTEKGTVLLVYECRSGHSDWAEIDIGLRRSEDGGKTFSECGTVVHGNGKTVNNPVLISDADKVLLIWQEEYYRTFISESYDDGITFINKTELTEQLRNVNYDYTVIACGPGHGIAFGNGRYAVPLWMAKNEDPHAHHPSVFSVMCSEDGGRHWRTADILSDDKLTDPSEASAVVLSDGRLLLNIRNENPVQRRYLALFDSETMSFENKGFCDTLPDPTCFAGMASDGKTVYYSGCDDTEDRINLKLKVSRDNGRTFSESRLISEFGGYSDMAVSNDGQELYVFYEMCEGDRIELHFQTIKIKNLQFT